MRNNPARVGGPASPVQSVDRALSILEILARRGECGVTEIGDKLGVHKSTAFRLLAALETRGYVEQSQDRGGYRLAFGIVRLSSAVTAQLDLTRESKDAAQRIAAELGETVNVAILDEGYAVNITQVRGAAAVATFNWVGQNTPIHATSSGKILAAFAPGEVRAVILAGRFQRFTPSTITDRKTLEQNLEQVRTQGWAKAAEEWEVGMNAISAPIWGPEGSVIAAISVAGPAYRLKASSLPDIANRVIDAGREVTNRVGFSS